MQLKHVLRFLPAVALGLILGCGNQEQEEAPEPYDKSIDGAPRTLPAPDLSYLNKPRKVEAPPPPQMPAPTAGGHAAPDRRGRGFLSVGSVARR